MTNIKAIFIDIDGTLLNSNRELTPRVKSALKQANEKGVKIVLCTGRPLKGVQPLLEALDLIGSQQYVITYNGSLVMTTDGSRVIAEFALDMQALKEIKDIAETFHTYYHAADRDYMYTTSRDIGIYMAHEANLVNMPIRVRTLEEMEQLNITIQKMMITDDPEKLDDVIAKLPTELSTKYTLVKSAPFYLEILNPFANKGNAVKALVQHLGISLENVMAIGDNHNDLDMIEIVGESVAMGNAVSSVKSIAKHHTATCDEDGVAVIVEKLVL